MTKVWVLTVIGLGRDFGAYVTHETGRYIYFYIGQKGFLIWSTPTWAHYNTRSLMGLQMDMQVDKN